MKPLKSILYAGAGLLCLALIGTVAVPKARAAVRGALVEIVFPSTPFRGPLQHIDQYALSIQPASGTLGVSAMTLANFDGVARTVQISQPTFTANGNCANGLTNGYIPGSFFQVVVQPNSTLHLSYPTPLVLSGGGSCLQAFSDSTQLNVYVEGFVN